MDKGKFDPSAHLMDMRGKDYLEVKWRIVWFREEHTKGSITTNIESYDPAIVKATVADGEGNVLATGLGSPKTQGVAAGRPFEGAETAAIGRALAVAGYGTQFTGEEEGEHLADAPVASRKAKVTAPEVPNNDPRKWTNAHTEALIKVGLVKNKAHAVNTLNLSMLPIDASPTEVVDWGQAYLKYRVDKNGKILLSSSEAASKANDEIMGA